MRIYGDALSGNCYKIQLLAHHLDVTLDWVAMDIVAGDTQTDDYLKKNAAGKIPLLELEDGRKLTESNAILNYIADGTSLLPSDAWQRAQILSWQFFEQYSHEPYIAVARFINLYLGLPDDRLEEYRAKQAGGHKALAVMEAHLSNNDYLAGDQMSIADISLYAYTHVAHEGGFDLAQYPRISAWLNRIESQPKHLAMQNNH